MVRFNLTTEFEPSGDQKQAIEKLVQGIGSDASKPGSVRDQVLLGVTGSGKTFTMAQVIAETQRPALVMAPNKTLAAQLYQELRSFFPDNAVEYFVSYYDYYQPEAYVASTDTFIEKDALINDTIDRLRHAATRSLLSRRDVIIVASVSCIYGIGSAEAYYGLLVALERGQKVNRDDVIRKLVEIQYERNQMDLHRGSFRVRGDVLEIVPASEEDDALRIEWFGSEVDRIVSFDSLTGEIKDELDKIAIYPASHYVTLLEDRNRALGSIREELGIRLSEFRKSGALLEAQRLEQRTCFDLEMMEQTGHCKGIENYSRHLTGRSPGEPPPTLLDYFPEDFVLFVDESHVTIPQIGGMWRGDRSRKSNLVDFGFRLPSAIDNRPLTFDEFNERVDQVVYISATPGDYEMERCREHIVEQIVRPTGLVDPEIDVKPVSNQVDDLLGEIRARVAKNERVLVTTLTKRMAEHLTEYYEELGVRVRYLHSDISALERIQIIRDLRLGVFDVLVGINLLREGLDLPEVSLVAILDADKEGFLRSARSLIQTTGRAARNVEGRVIMYADKITNSMKVAISETDRRRCVQSAYNELHGIVPQTIQKEIAEMGVLERLSSKSGASTAPGDAPQDAKSMEARVVELKKKMWAAAKDLDFESAARLRDELVHLEEGLLAFGGSTSYERTHQKHEKRRGTKASKKRSH
jgi:excinuclease ABC subunit B